MALAAKAPAVIATARKATSKPVRAADFLLRKKAALFLRINFLNISNIVSQSNPKRLGKKFLLSLKRPN
jgi:hypothetical protein